MADQHQHSSPSNQKQPRKLLSKGEKFMLFLALAILTIVILQKFGINMIETTEQIEISKEDQYRTETEDTPQEVNTLHSGN